MHLLEHFQYFIFILFNQNSSFGSLEFALAEMKEYSNICNISANILSKTTEFILPFKKYQKYSLSSQRIIVCFVSLPQTLAWSSWHYSIQHRRFVTNFPLGR